MSRSLVGERFQGGTAWAARNPTIFRGFGAVPVSSREHQSASSHGSGSTAGQGILGLMAGPPWSRNDFRGRGQCCTPVNVPLALQPSGLFPPTETQTDSPWPGAHMGHRPKRLVPLVTGPITLVHLESHRVPALCACT